MHTSYQFFGCAVLLYCMLSPQAGLPHNGGIACAYPVQEITVDANLSDWPEDARRYAIRYNPDGSLPEDSQDLRGHFRIGYNTEQQALYLAVEITDDVYIRSEENPEWWAHDMHVLYIDPRHSARPNGVLGLEFNEYVKKIVGHEENWDPMVRNYSWEQVEVKMLQQGHTTIYEWKVTLEGYIGEGKVLGFDYLVFDKDDPEEDFQTVGWGPANGIKHQCSPCLGDVILMGETGRLAEISGKLSIADSIRRPKTLLLESLTQPDFRVNAGVDSTGAYEALLPEGRYRITATSGVIWNNDSIYRADYQGSPTVELQHGRPLAYDNPVLAIPVPRPDLIPKEGVLHKFGIGDEEIVDNFIQTYMEYYGIPGVSLALIKNGRLAYHHVYGVANNSTGTAVTPENLFEAASITKPVFAYVVLRLAERNIIDLDKPLHEYLPFDELEGKFPEYRKMTARHVLIHKSGLPNWGRELLRTPGTEYGYSGEGFEYLKRVVSSITGKDIEVVVNEELKQPLDLNHMEFSDSPYLRKVAATGHFDEIPTVQSLPQEAGMAWSMYTEARAFTDFALALQYRRGLQPATFREMMTIHSEYPEDERDPDKGKQGMGLGIGLAETDWGRTFFHGGNNGDFRCQFMMYEDLKMGFAVFTNANTGYFLASDLALFLVEGRKPAN